MRQRKPLPKVNRARLKKRRATQFGPQAKACRLLPCCVCTSRAVFWHAVKVLAANPDADWPRVSDPHHEKTRGAGGLDEHTIPLCRDHHIERGAATREDFERRHGGIDLRRIASSLKGALAA